MDIVYSSSDSYCEIAGISILSLLEHNRNVKELNLYLIDNQISAENKQKLENMIASFGRTLTYLAHPDIEKRPMEHQHVLPPVPALHAARNSEKGAVH